MHQPWPATGPEARGDARLDDLPLELVRANDANCANCANCANDANDAYRASVFRGVQLGITHGLVH